MSSADPKQAKKKGGKSKKEGGQHKFVEDEAYLTWENPTPFGQKKSFETKMEDKYQPKKVEAAWGAYWEKEGFFTPDTESDKEPFVIVLPPPNVTGSLHLGHALTCSVEDCLVRWNRMLGKNTLWLPGFDHAGIATQVVVEKKIMRESGKTRHDLGREAFLKEVWAWKESRSGVITEQLRRIGASVDWTRACFTMDEKRTEAVTEAFIRMFQDGHIYRSNRIVNWSCTLKTAISSIEVDHIDLDKPTMLKVPGYEEKVQFGAIHDLVYKVKDSDREIIISTTRVETMLGDVAIAVHPDDPRYEGLVGKELVHPFLPDRKMVIVADAELVDMNFGTGAVKITPAHDPNDFLCGQRHNLPQINILTDTGLINENGGPFAGMKRFEARVKIAEALEKMGQYRGFKPNVMSVGVCSRSGDIIEPVVRPQWWVHCQPLADRSVAAVRDGVLKIIPNSFDSTWYNWLEECQDWCISRQLWWGHRIPAWYVDVELTAEQQAAQDANKNDERKQVDPRWVICRTEEEARAKAADLFPHIPAADIKISQDPDVLDTWFSSGLFPFSTMNWPEKSVDFEKFFPGALLETGHDILFFWVARMVMMSIALTDKLPFDAVYLHAMVRDKTGRKMSKSLGNVIDPVDIINGIALEKLHEQLMAGNLDPKEVKRAISNQKIEFPNGISECGADALRFGLLSYSAAGRDINLDVHRVVSYRQFCNKLWNAVIFGLRHFPDDFVPVSFESLAAPDARSNFADAWILSKLHETVETVNASLTAYEFAAATQRIYAFWLKDLCGVYLEVSKGTLYDKENTSTLNKALNTLYWCYHAGLRLLHPFMPFVTEELFHRLPGAIQEPAVPSIVLTAYPTSSHTACFADTEIEDAIEFALHTTHELLSLRNSFNLGTRKIPVFLECRTPEILALVSKYSGVIQTLANASEVVGFAAQNDAPDRAIVGVITKDCLAHVPAKGLVDFTSKLVKLDRELETMVEITDKLAEQIESKSYQESKLPAKIKAKNLEKLTDSREKIRLMKEAVAQSHALMEQTEIDAVEVEIVLQRAQRKAAAQEKNVKALEKEIAQLEKKALNQGKKKLKQAELDALPGRIAEKKELLEEAQKLHSEYLAAIPK